MLLHSKIIGEGHPLVILHGFLGMGDNWKTLGNQFAEKGYQVHLVDQRNHGRSFHDANFNYDLLAEDVLQYCAEHELEEINLIGHSMGGKTAMVYATSYPKSVSKLIIADIAPKAYPQHHQDILKGLSSLDFTATKSRGAADTALSNYIPEIGTRQFLLKNLYWVEKGVLGLRMNLTALIENIEEVGKPLAETARFEGETLFLRGGRSGYITPEDELHITLHFPKAELITIPNAGHWLHAENPKAFFEAVMDFL